MSESEEAPESEQKQRTLGLIPAEQDNHIETLTEKIRLRMTEAGLEKPKIGQLLADSAEMGLEFLEKWLTSSVSAREALKIARQESQKKRKEGTNKILKKILREELTKSFLETHLEEKHG